MQTENDNDAARTAGVQDGAWRDPTLPVADRVAALLAEMTLEEKVAQLSSAWVGIDPDHDNVAPHQHELVDVSIDFDALTRFGLGQLTRPFGTAPVEPADGAKAVARIQADIVAANRFRIPAVVHEECLTGFMTWRATIYPTPLAWGATFDPALVEQMAAQIGAGMRAVGVHQGLAPVLDVTRDPRWGRTEETMGEDPYLVGTIGTAYVRGLQSAGVIATLKHFVGYSASVGARNFGPVAVGQRELHDVLLPPFEMAIRERCGAGDGRVRRSRVGDATAPAHRGCATPGAWHGRRLLRVSFQPITAADPTGPGAGARRRLDELPSVRCYGAAVGRSAPARCPSHCRPRRRRWSRSGSACWTRTGPRAGVAGPNGAPTST